MTTKQPSQSNAVMAIVSHAADSVAIVLKAVSPGQSIVLSGCGTTDHIVARETIPAFHKIALKDFNAGDFLRRSNVAIGKATCTIQAGELVHTHNLASHYA